MRRKKVPVPVVLLAVPPPVLPAAQNLLSRWNPLPVDESIADALTEAVAANPEVMAWFQIPGTVINEPVTQTTDNSFYMVHDNKKASDVYGCVFAHFNNAMASMSDLDRNTVLFGHNKSIANLRGNEQNFATLLYFQGEDYAKEHRYMTLTIGEETSYWLIFAALDCENNNAQQNFYYWNTYDTDANENPLTDEAWQSLLDQAKDRSYWDYGIEVDAKDKILTLSTCSYDWGYDGGYNTYAKFVVMARQLREDELKKGLEAITELPEIKANEDRQEPTGLTRIHISTQENVEAGK